MRIISIKVLRDYWILHPETKSHLESWKNEVEFSNWKNSSDIKEKYQNASILKSRRVVFNIKGNDFRLVVSIAFKIGIIYVKFIGTHKEYDKIDANTVELEIKNGNKTNQK